MKGGFLTTTEVQRVARNSKPFLNPGELFDLHPDIAICVEFSKPTV